MKKSIYCNYFNFCTRNHSTISCGQTSTTTSTDQSAKTVTPDTASQGTDEDGDGIPDTVEKTYGTNPHLSDTDGDGTNDKDDTSPLFTDNLISETSTTALPVKITDSRVEDNATADPLGNYIC